MCERLTSSCWTEDNTHGVTFLIIGWPLRSFILPPPLLLVEEVARLIHHKGNFILRTPALGDSDREPGFPIPPPLLPLSPLPLSETGRIYKSMEKKFPPRLGGNLTAHIPSEFLGQSW